MAKKKSRSKFWFVWYPVAGGRGPKYNVEGKIRLSHRYHHQRSNLVGTSFHKKLYPTIKHLPTFRRNIDVFADLRR